MKNIKSFISNLLFFRFEQICTAWNRDTFVEKIKLEPLNKDEMILIADSSANSHRGGGFYHPAPEVTSFIINTVSIWY